ncbi:hypothetical protein KXW70_007221 [Aspergillus fumigatus]|nr:hypothetical protein KXW70_007221 [Aspergillus fumigatus]
MFIAITVWRLKHGYFQPFKSASQKFVTSTEKLYLSGFSSDGDVEKIGCDDLRQTGYLDIERSILLHDNITQIALSVSSHPMIQEILDQTAHGVKIFEPHDLIESRLSQFAGSGVWLSQLNVYIVASRVVYTAPGTSWPTISFLRGRVFDKNWRHLENYTIDWYGKTTTFPLLFEIPTVWWKDGSFFGPEDPRIVLEEGVQGAEPIIVFNMILNATGYPRVMCIFKPFSRIISYLRIRGEERKPTEKNWAPFFYRADSERKPSEHLYFVYSFNPLQVLKCKVDTGSCDWFYRATSSPDFPSLPHQDPHGEMRGGTNFVQVPLAGQSGHQFFVGFPRTHVQFCQSGSSYRPELVVMSAFDSEFRFIYASVATDFGNAVLDQNELLHPCTTGAFLIPNSILRWDHGPGEDAMALSFSVADESIHIVNLHGMLDFIQDLLYVANSVTYRGDHNTPLQKSRWSVIEKEIISCAVDSAANSSRKDAIKTDMLSEELRN